MRPAQGPESRPSRAITGPALPHLPHLPRLQTQPGLTGAALAAAGRRQCLAHALGWPLSLTGLTGLTSLMGLVSLVGGCAAPWPEVPAGPGSPSASQRLRESAQAHGLAAWRQVRDLSLDLQRGLDRHPAAPAGTLQLRWLPAAGLLAWQDLGLAQPLQGWRRWAGPAPTGSTRMGPAVRLWQAGELIDDPARLRAAAQLADLLRLLMLGPVALVDSGQPVNWAEPATLDGRRCDQLTLDLPSAPDESGISRLALFIDRDQGLMRRLRLMSIAEQGQAGAMAATWDLPEPIALHGQQWPRRCQRVTPARGAGAHSWHLLGLDRNRGLQPADVEASRFSAIAAAPAAALPA